MPFYANKTALFMGMTMMSASVQADWKTTFDTGMYYTDDVALFSVTRRLSLKDDPTQPVVDRPNQGGDFIYEPSAALEWSGNNALGELTASAEAGGYIFVDQSAFSHGLYEFKLSQTFATDTKVSLDYNFVPDLFLGKNVLRQAGVEESEQDEKLNNHFWSLHLDQALTHHLTVRLLGRYGLRRYNAPFEHRDTQFWTIGPHLEWAISPDVELLLGYHYEHGVADHQKAINIDDDISYVNHYASAELKIRLLERLSGVFIVDYEKNDFTSQYLNDEHHSAAENLFQGEIELLYELDKATTVKLGWQHGSRKLTTENQNVKNNNVWLGIEYAF
ncbi:MAG: hypothetical protein HOP02_06845 [Methylococcaceae bacterium]|nr:hypothetical protein [Methylococcaceae bacterium]